MKFPTLWLGLTLCGHSVDCIRYCICRGSNTVAKLMSDVLINIILEKHTVIISTYHLFPCVQNGWTALHIACQEGHDNIATVLLKAKADPNIQAEVSPLNGCISDSWRVKFKHEGGS